MESFFAAIVLVIFVAFWILVVLAGIMVGAALIMLALWPIIAFVGYLRK